jgi:hypothetical protein
LLEHLIAARFTEIKAKERKASTHAHHHAETLQAMLDAAQSVVHHQPDMQLTSYRTHADHLIADINARIEVYAAPLCLNICTTMYNKLPRKLRDMVYTYIVGNDSTLAINDDFLGPLVYNWKHTQHDISDDLPDAFRYGINADFVHALDRKFVGAHFKFELVQTWYRATTFVFPNCQFVPYFLENDRLGYGTEPRDRITKVTIMCHLYPKNEMVHDIHLLAGLHAGAHITFEVRTLAYVNASLLSSTSNYMARRAVHGLTIMFSPIKDLLSKGHMVSFKIDHVEPFEVVKEDLTKEKWSRKIKALHRIQSAVIEVPYLALGFACEARIGSLHDEDDDCIHGRYDTTTI